MEELIELVEDLYVRFAKTEEGQYVQIRQLQADIQAVQNNYNMMRTRRYAVGTQNLIIMIVGVLFMFLVTWLTRGILEPLFNILSNNSIMVLIYLFALPTILSILNTIRGRKKTIELRQKAEEWREQVGDKQIAQLNSSIAALRAEVSQYLNANSLYPYFQKIGWANTDDCGRIHDIIVKYKLNSIMDAFSIYNDILDREYEREQDRYRQQQILEAIEENNQYQAELAEQGRRAEFDRSVIELQLFEMKNRH
ncbi:MAG: hypothetical protein HDT44_03290 [Ruminococcaceae bacterium]|nr:hypothetical protein [Oscillospiraceae bacterium]